LDHRVLAIEREQLLGPLFAAQRPKARAAPSGKNYGMEVRILSHKCSRRNQKFCAIRRYCPVNSWSPVQATAFPERAPE